MIRISDAAQAHFAKLLANQEEGTQIRVFVINPGTPNAECGVSYCPPDAVEATDTALKFDLLTAYVDELSAPYLEDAEIDFVTDFTQWCGGCPGLVPLSNLVEPR